MAFFGVGDREIKRRVMELLDETELNAVVIDVKGDRGWIVYKSSVPLAQVIGATRVTTLKDPEGLLKYLKGKGIYTIARIVVFKDNILARARPDLAIIDSRTGKPWIDREGMAWVDPFKREVWDYNLAIAAGIPGYRYSVAYPYEIVFLSPKRAVRRLQGIPVKIRPWLQDFRDYGFDGRPYTAREVQAQIKASWDAGAWGEGGVRGCFQ